jgi:hypothetical protein
MPSRVGRSSVGISVNEHSGVSRPLSTVDRLFMSLSMNPLTPDGSDSNDRQKVEHFRLQTARASASIARSGRRSGDAAAELVWSDVDRKGARLLAEAGLLYGWAYFSVAR